MHRNGLRVEIMGVENVQKMRKLYLDDSLRCRSIGDSGDGSNGGRLLMDPGSGGSTSSWVISLAPLSSPIKDWLSPNEVGQRLVGLMGNS